MATLLYEGDDPFTLWTAQARVEKLRTAMDEGAPCKRVYYEFTGGQVLAHSRSDCSAYTVQLGHWSDNAFEYCITRSNS
jgi:hypothetical protein